VPLQGAAAVPPPLAESQRRLDAALLAGEVGTFEWDVLADRLWGDANFQRIFGITLDASGTAPLASTWSRCIPMIASGYSRWCSALSRRRSSTRPSTASSRAA
jgi:hypothetical protein